MKIGLSIVALCVTVSVCSAQWRTQPIDTTADFRGLSAVSKTVCWVSGTQGTVGRTVDGGKTWTAKVIPGCDALDFRDIEAFGEATAYAMSAGPGEASQIWKTTDGAKTWTKQFVNGEKAGFLDAIAFWDETHGLALGDPVNGRFQLLTTSDGKTWSSIEGPKALADEGCFAASGTCLITQGANDAWFVTGGAQVSRILHSTDRGKTWYDYWLSRAGVASKGFFAIHFRDAKNGVIVGGDYKKPVGDIATAAVTADGGATWTVIDGQLPYRSAITWTGSQWLAAGPTGISQSDKRARKWLVDDLSSWNSIQMTKDGSGWAAGPKGRIGWQAAVAP